MSADKTNVGKLFTGVEHADKYQSSNWIARRLVNTFMKTILETVKSAGSQDVHEVGCGEGHILGMLARHQFGARGSDISEESLAIARAEADAHNLRFSLTAKSIYDLDPAVDSADTILCCEVLEHLTDPELALRKLVATTRKDLILSVPREPIWHLLNIARGQYWYALGNTPGHFQHWTRDMFVAFVEPYAQIISVKTPLPWTVVHCRPKA